MTLSADLSARMGYRFGQPKLLKLALTHPSAGDKNNQRLEYLGDAVLELCISHLLYHTHPRYPEGRLTRLRAALVCEAMLVDVAEKLELEKHVRSSPPLAVEKRGRSGILADAVEAVLAAIYLEGGLDAAMAFVSRHWGDALTREDTETSPKSALQEHYQAMGQENVTYRTLEEKGPAHARQFLCAVYAGDQELARAKGSTKKQAEQAAARKAMRLLSKGKHTE